MIKLIQLVDSIYNCIIIPDGTIELASMEDRDKIAEELKKFHCDSGKILFDLILINGNSFNRFVEGYFYGSGISEDSLLIVSDCEQYNKLTIPVLQNDLKFTMRNILTHEEVWKIINSEV